MAEVPDDAPGFASLPPPDPAQRVAHVGEVAARPGPSTWREPDAPARSVEGRWSRWGLGWASLIAAAASLVLALVPYALLEADGKGAGEEFVLTGLGVLFGIPMAIVAAVIAAMGVIAGGVGLMTGAKESRLFAGAALVANLAAARLIARLFELLGAF